MNEGAEVTEREESSLVAWLPVLTIIAFTAVAHFSSVDAVFIWDDHPIAIERAQAGEGVWSWATRPFVDNGMYYRPLVSLSYLLDGALHGENPAGFHLTNLALHLLNTALLYTLATQQGCRPWTASIAVMVWATLPRLTEAVTWISGRTDLIMAAFVLGALLVWPWSPQTGDVRSTRAATLRLGASTVLLLCAFGAKETAVAGVVAVVVGELAAAFGTRGGDRAALLSPAKLWARGALAASPLVLWLGVRHLVLTDPPTTIELPDAGTRALVVLQALGTYATMVVTPFHPQSLIGIPGQVEPAHVVLGGVALGLGVTAGVLARRWITTRVAPLLALALTSLGIVLPVIPLPVNVVAADRFLYLPLAAGAVCVALALESLTPRWRTPLGAAAALVATTGLILTHVRAADYVEPTTFWTKALVQTRGQNSIALRNLALNLSLECDYENAARLSRAALVRLPHSDPVTLHRNLGNSLTLAGRHEAALRSRALLVQLEPNEVDHWSDVARSHAYLAQYEQAERALARAFTLAPHDTNLHSLRAGVVQLRKQGLVSTSNVPLTRLQQQIALADQLRWQQTAIATWQLVIAHPQASPDLAAQGAAALLQMAPYAQTCEGVLAFKKRFPNHPHVSALTQALAEREAKHRLLVRNEARWSSWVPPERP